MHKHEKQPVSFSGNVIEIVDCDDYLCAKILLKPEYLEIYIDALEDIHLGDQIQITGDLAISKIIPYLGRT